MSAGNLEGYQNSEAEQTLKSLVQALESVTDLLAPVGAQRRGEATTEFEYLAIPRKTTADLFGGAEPDVGAIEAALQRWGHFVRRGDGALTSSCSLTTSSSSSQVRAIIHTVPETAEWGLLLIRHTGPASFIAWLLQRLQDLGYALEPDGAAIRSSSGQRVSLPDEDAVFRLAELTPIAPEQRYVPEEQSASAGDSGGNDRSAVSRNHLEHQGRGMPIERD